MGLDVVVLGPKALATVGAGDSVEGGWVSELQGDEDLDRGVAGPAAQVPQIPTVVEHPGEERVGGDPAGALGGDGADPGDLADLSLADVLPAPGDDLARTRSSGRRERPTGVAPDSKLA
jgi:hypothetical protein